MYYLYIMIALSMFFVYFFLKWEQKGDKTGTEREPEVKN